MKSSNFKNSKETLEIKKELEMLTKKSKMEYHVSTNSRKASLKKGLGTHGNLVPEQLRLKAEEVLGVVGNKRQSGTAPHADSKQMKKRSNVDKQRDYTPVMPSLMTASVQSNENRTLDVVMKGTGLIKREKVKMEPDGDFQNTDVDDLLAQIFYSEQEIDKPKPAIISVANTTKPVTFESRKTVKKYQVPFKPSPSRNRKEVMQRRKSNISRSTSKKSVENSSLPASPDLSVQKNLTSFHELDKEFYDIMKSKLKLDLKEKAAVDEIDMLIETVDNMQLDSDKDDLDKKISVSYSNDMLEAPDNMTHPQSINNKEEQQLDAAERNEVNTESMGRMEIANEIDSFDALPTKNGTDVIIEPISGQTNKIDMVTEQAVREDDDVTTSQLLTQQDSECKIPPEEYEDIEDRVKNKSHLEDEPCTQISQVISDDNSSVKTSYSMDESEAIKALQISGDVSYEDIVHVMGEKASTGPRPDLIPVNSKTFVSKSALHNTKFQRKKSFLSSWTKAAKREVSSRDHSRMLNIHHFCTSFPSIQLPSNLKIASKEQHTPGKFAVHKSVDKKLFKESEMVEESQEENTNDTKPYILTLMAQKEEPTEEELRLTDLASRILDDALKQTEEKKQEKSFLKLQNIVNQIFSEDDESVLGVDGRKADLKHDATRLYWTPAPPKFDLPPDIVKQQLIPKYQGALFAKEEELERFHETEEESDGDSSNDEEIEVEESAKFRLRFIDRPHGSAGLTRTQQMPNVEEEEVKEENESHVERRFDSDSESDDSQQENQGLRSIESNSTLLVANNIREPALRKEDSQESKDDATDYPTDAPKRRAMSQPLLAGEKSDFQKFDSGFATSIQELNYQLEKVTEFKKSLLAQNPSTEDNSTEDNYIPLTQFELVDDVEKIDDSATESYTTREETNKGHLSSIDQFSTSRRNTKSSTSSKLVTQLSKPSRNLNLRKKPQRKKQRDPEREKQIREFLEKPANKIARSISLEAPRRLLDETSVMTNDDYLKRPRSLDCHLNFFETVGRDDTGDEDEIFQWTKERYWYQWFDELYPPSVQSVEDRPSTVQSEVQPNVSDEILQHIEVITPPNKTESQEEIYQLLLREIESMTKLIESTESKETLAIHICRRGTCYRKVGELKKAWDDLERAIELEPKLLNAYWNRHLLHLLQENTKKALADLDHILKHNTSHIGAYRSRAEIYKKKGDLTMAIFNYSQAIKLNPEDADIYYERAYMFQERGDILLALEDFKQAHILLPTRTEAARNIGIYHFNNRSWSAAINDFTALISQEPYNSEAYTYRARAYANMAQYENALNDLSLAIHLDPNNFISFYYRGCLLRRSSQRQALQDLSTSILLNDSAANVDAFLHRGILYNEMKRWEESVADFEAALRLDSNIPAAHVNLGLIQMVRMNNPHMAIRRFNTAIRVDPTYVRAYICRAEASQKIKNVRAAILDYTRAIHIRPDVTDYRMARGKLLLEEKKFELASYHIKQCAQMTKGVSTSPTQQAAVETFLKNYTQAIEVLEKTVKSKPLPPLFILLGKTKMKAKMYSEAIESFERALTLMKPWDPKAEWPLQAGNVYYLIGMVYVEMVNYSLALEAFNNALKINPEYAEAYYQRGLSKMKLRHAKAIQDFNRALAFTPKFFQAYLSRAAYYGMKGRYAKAIMNCNEAIRLQPKSIRGYLYRGALKYHIKAYKLAVKDLTEAVSIDRECNVAYFNRAVCYQEMRYFQQALKDYGIVLLLEKKENMKVLQNRGLLYLEIGDIYNALKDFADASKLEPKNPKLHHTLGICYQKLERFEDAIKCFSNALKTDRFFVDALLGRGNTLMDYGTNENNTLARRDFLRALHLDPMCLPARVNLAYSLQVQGRYQAAWMQFTKCIDLNDEFKAAYEGRAVINLQMRNTFGAFLDINSALKIEETAEFLTNRGVINQFMADNVNAMRDYQAALKKDPSYSLAYYNAANLYFNQRQFQQALEYYDRAIGWNKYDESAFVNRAITRVMLKHIDGALEDFDRAAELSPYTAHIYFNRGNLYASLAMYENAEKDYTTALSLQPLDALVYKRRADVRGKMSKKDAALLDYKTAILIQEKMIKAGE